ncbi:hypothetical protein C7C56_014130 [Massilia glaciei]|uniref:Uncharacterized protein n=1 Tax=Massilia glaciei TaxID=1524097 RepID=A0A2U2HJL2_9BURK|nr:hypothetical protein C7C56_014130 [Massilia glaciei]
MLLSVSAAAGAETIVYTSEAGLPAASTGPVQGGGAFDRLAVAAKVATGGDFVLPAAMAGGGAGAHAFKLADSTADSLIGVASTRPVGPASVDPAGAAYWSTANNAAPAVPEADSYTMLLAGLLVMAWLIKQHDN